MPSCAACSKTSLISTVWDLKKITREEKKLVTMNVITKHNFIQSPKTPKIICDNFFSNQAPKISDQTNYCL